MTDYRAIAACYLAAWNEPDPTRRRTLIAASWAAGARYEDPLMTGEGHEAIAAMIDTARTQFPGLVFMPRGEPDGYGRHLRFSWALGPDGGAPVAGGTDFVLLDAEEHFKQVTGFLDGSVGRG